MLWVSLALFLFLVVSIDVSPSTQLVWSGATILIMFILRFILFQDIRTKFAPTRFLRLLFMLLAGMIALRYIWWRTFHSLPIDGDIFSIILAILLYIAEVQALIIYFFGMFIYISPKKREPIPLPNDKTLLPSVDIFIPTFNEPSSLLRTTLLATKNVRYPAEKLNIYLLDDGGTKDKCNQSDPVLANQAQLRNKALIQLCKNLNVNYLTRENNKHAKAGNINAALPKTSGDLILILDCDHVPTMDILENTVAPFLEDKKLYLVQTPHFLINDDPIEKNTNKPINMPSESEMFYTSTMRGLDNWNAAFFCGSGAVLRRKYLEEIGGICTKTVTEDIETSVELHSRGYNSIYIHKPMLAGLQPETFAGFMTQRLRWAHGMLQVFMLKNPLVIKGLTVWQRICFLSMVSYWFFSYMRLMFLLAPVAYLIFGLKLFDAAPLEIIIYALPNLIAFLLYFNVVFGRHRWFLVSEVFETLQCMFSIRTVFSVLMNPKKGSFNVTPKDENISQDFISPLAFPLFALFGLTLLAAIVGIIRLIADPALWAHDAIVILWTMINLLIVTASLGALYEKKQLRKSTRFAVDIDTVLIDNNNKMSGKIIDLSATGMRVIIKKPDVFSLANNFVANTFCDASGKTCDIKCKLVRTIEEKNTVILGIQFTPSSVQEEGEIIALGYGSGERWRNVLRNRNHEFGFAAGIKHFFSNSLMSGISLLWLLTRRAFSFKLFRKDRRNND